MHFLHMMCACISSHNNTEYTVEREGGRAASVSFSSSVISHLSSSLLPPLLTLPSVVQSHPGSLIKGLSPARVVLPQGHYRHHRHHIVRLIINQTVIKAKLVYSMYSCRSVIGCYSYYTYCEYNLS